MEDENGIELSLGLSCGGSTGKVKTKDGSSESKAEEVGSSMPPTASLKSGEGPFKHFFNSASEKQDQGGRPRSDTHDNFWTDLKKLPSQGRDPQSEPHMSTSRLARYHQDLWPEASSNKRKFPYEEQQTKHGEDADQIDVAKKTSHLAVATEGSLAKDEDVAESGAEGSSSRLISPIDEGTKQYMGSGSTGSKFKDKQGFMDPSVTESQGLKQFSVPANEQRGLPYGVSQFSLQPMAVMTAPHQLPGKAPSPAANPTFVQLMPSANSESPMSRSVNFNNFPRPFGYSPIQLPTLEQFSAYASQGLSNGMPPGDRPEDALNLSQAGVHMSYSSVEALPSEGRIDLTKAASKQQNVEESATCSSSHPEDESKGTQTIFRQKEISDQSPSEGVHHEGSAIEPGIAANLKFGGCGSRPDLPWVSATGSGPHAKTISGVTYKYGVNQIRIVCACHGSHMSPEEFVQHASSDVPTSDNNTVPASFRSSNPSASAAPI